MAKEVNSNNNSTDKNKGIHRETLSHCLMPHTLLSCDSLAPGQIPHSELSRTAQGIEYPISLAILGPGCVSSWLLVKTNPVLDEHRA